MRSTVPVAQRLELGIRVVGQRVGGFLKPLVDVGILEDHAMELVVQFAGGNLQVGNPHGSCCQPAGCPAGSSGTVVSISSFITPHW